MLVRSKVRKEVGREYYHFRHMTLKKRKRDIFESCGKIYFYACIYEYFTYNPNIHESLLGMYIKYRISIEDLWCYYLKHEDTSVATWNGIEGLMILIFQERGEESYEQCKAGAC